jgi:transcriptional regulator with XRE-family HTH domain
VKRPNSKRVLKDLGRRAAELRQALGLTQAELADRLTVTSRYVQSVEAGQENLTVESLTVLAAVLDVAVVALFEPPTSRVVRLGRPKR